MQGLNQAGKDRAQELIGVFAGPDSTYNIGYIMAEKREADGGMFDFFIKRCQANVRSKIEHVLMTP